MKKHPVFVTLFVAVVILGFGVSAAYYNTKSFAFDEETVLFSRDNEGITVLDYKIYYKDIETVYEDTKGYMPKKAISTAPHLVPDLDTLTYIMYI